MLIINWLITWRPPWLCGELEASAFDWLFDVWLACYLCVCVCVCRWVGCLVRWRVEGIWIVERVRGARLDNRESCLQKEKYRALWRDRGDSLCVRMGMMERERLNDRKRWQQTSAAEKLKWSWRLLTLTHLYFTFCPLHPFTHFSTFLLSFYLYPLLLTLLHLLLSSNVDPLSSCPLLSLSFPLPPPLHLLRFVLLSKINQLTSETPNI